MKEPKLLDETAKLHTGQAAEYLGVTKATLDTWRVNGGGPIYYKVGSSVRYQKSDLDKWLAARRFKFSNSPAPQDAEPDPTKTRAQVERDQEDRAFQAQLLRRYAQVHGELFGNVMAGVVQQEQSHLTIEAAINKAIECLLPNGGEKDRIESVVAPMARLAILGHLNPVVRERLRRPDCQMLLKECLDYFSKKA